MEGGNNTREITDKIKERDDCLKETIRTEKEEGWSKRRKRIIFERLLYHALSTHPSKIISLIILHQKFLKMNLLRWNLLWKKKIKKIQVKRLMPESTNITKGIKLNTRKNVGIVIPGPIIRKTVNSLGASIARGWGTLKPIAGREKLIGSTGKPRKGVGKKKKKKERKKGEKGPKRKEKSS